MAVGWNGTTVLREMVQEDGLKSTHSQVCSINKTN